MKTSCDIDHYHLEEDIIVLKNVTKFHKILFKTFHLRERTSLGVMYVLTDIDVRTDRRTYGRTGVTLNAPTIVMAGA